jgi:hypothetical protein
MADAAGFPFSGLRVGFGCGGVLSAFRSVSSRLRSMSVSKGRVPLAPKRPIPPIGEVARGKKHAERAAKRKASEDAPYDSPQAPALPEDFPKKGDETEDITFAASGRAMSDWTRIEIALTRLFITLVQGKGAYIMVAARSFGTVRTIEGKLDMLKAAAEPFFMIEIDRCRRIKSDLARFFENKEIQLDELCRSVKDLASVRNKIAHGVVGQLYQKPRNELGYALQPAPMDNKSTVFQTPKYAFTSKGLNKHAEAFRDLRLAASTLNVKIRHLHDLLEQEERDRSAELLEK